LMALAYERVRVRVRVRVGGWVKVRVDGTRV